ncbi:hypothetical protein [Flavobacterium sp. NKUCC04_CG]|uniref:hypothetical protein n=1 Tax=Flavobacterium sp. NKUCC04_CG TaxID=2842121 RepID=UPI001C5BE405|nr:hypothetical protein [Flavobacterium sp. NKUCC04_CG]MBW3519532.1 hypothetical protein [Flavobacterium sp. NKUCC04_CG]
MYLEIQAKFRLAIFEDLFYGDMNDCAKCQFLKGGVSFFIKHNQELKGPFKTHDNHYCIYYFTEMYRGILNQWIYVQDQNNSQSTIKFPLYLRTADVSDLSRFSTCILYINKNLSNPFELPNNWIDFNQKWKKFFDNRQLFVICEKQKLMTFN